MANALAGNAKDGDLLLLVGGQDVPQPSGVAVDLVGGGE